ncbi:hypothetical protein [Desulfovibrio inopinatus]|uniref:hypothetical protein n=1 Tax=Desulfovibrio inopinatus TaxID=102109 RepID=UPI000404F72C|nr:hypothetical protein [Desulfovibrio inopinatus]
MKMQHVRTKAKLLSVKIPFGATKVEAIRAIQRAEGYEDCCGRKDPELCESAAQCCFRLACAGAQQR